MQVRKCNKTAAGGITCSFGALFKVCVIGILNHKLEVAVVDLIKGWNE